MKIDELRDGKGQLPVYAWPGGYPMLYLAKDNGVLCPKCANAYTPERDNEEQLKPVAYDIHYEGAPAICEHCNAAIDAAYGDPDAEEANELQQALATIRAHVAEGIPEFDKAYERIKRAIEQQG